MPLISPEATPPEDVRRTSPYMPLMAYVAGVILLVLAGFQAFRQIEGLIQQEKLNDLNAIAAMKIGQIVSWRESQQRRGAALSFATLLPPEFEQWVREGAPEGPRRQKIAQMMFSWRHIYDYRAVALVDRQGAVRLAPSGGATLDAEDIELARQAMAGRKAVLSDIHNDSGNGMISIDLAAPLIVDDGNRSRVVGAAICHISPADFLYPLIQAWPVNSSTAETLLVRQEGESVLFLNELRHRKGAALTLRLPVNMPNLPPGMFLRGKLDPLNSVDYRGVPVVASVARIPGTTWLIVAKIDKAELFAPIVKLKQWSAAVGLVFLAGCGGLFFVWLLGIQARYRHLKAQRDAAIHGELLLKHFEYLTKYANDIIFVADENGNIIEANERAVSAFGYTRDELLGMPIRALRPPTQNPSVYNGQMARLLEVGELIFETESRRKDGSIFPVEVSARIIEIDGVKFLQGIIRDIAERKAAERRILRLNDLYAAISQTNAAMVRIKDQTALFQEICRIAVTYGHFRLAWIGLADAEQGRVMPVASNGPSTGYLDGLIISTDADKPEGQGPTAVTLHQGKSIVCKDIETDPRLIPWRDKAREYGLRSSATWPLRQEGKRIGVLTLYSSEINYFDDEMMALLFSISQDTSFALDNLAMEESLRQSEEKFRTLVENLPLKIFVKDTSSVYVSCNALYARDKKMQQSEIAGKTDFDFYPRELAEKRREYDKHIMAAGKAEEMQEEYIVDGQKKVIQVIKAPFKNSQGVVTGVLGVFWDITERKENEDILRLHSTILGNLSEGICLVRASDGVFVFTNPQFERMFGYGSGELLGKHVGIVNAPGEKNPEAEASAIMNELARTGAWNGEVQNIRKDGATFWCHARVSAFDHPQFGKVWVAVHENITEQKNAAAMHNEIERVGRLNIAVEMASGLAHELSQPLAAANSYLTGCLLRMKDADWDKEKLRRAVELSHKQTERSGNIINHLKNLIRKQSHERAMTDINALIRDTVDFLEHEIKQRGILIFMALSPLPSILANRVEIEQVLINLFKNAIEAMEGVTGPELRIATTDLRDSGQILVTVSDNGPSIPSAELATIFSLFQTSKKDGLGLGLSICRSLVENHGGRIWADAQREFGAEFNFTLPYEVNNE